MIASIGLLILVEGSIGWIWGNEIKFMPTAFPAHIYRVGGVAFSRQDISTIAISIAAVLVLHLLFQFTKLGLAMRAAAVRPDAARLVGSGSAGCCRSAGGSRPRSERSPA